MVGALEVKQSWVARKFEGTWHDQPDVALTGALMNNAWTLVNEVDAAKPLRIVRPANGYSSSNLPGEPEHAAVDRGRGEQGLVEERVTTAGRRTTPSSSRTASSRSSAR